MSNRIEKTFAKLRPAAFPRTSSTSFIFTSSVPICLCHGAPHSVMYVTLPHTSFFCSPRPASPRLIPVLVHIDSGRGIPAHHGSSFRLFGPIRFSGANGAGQTRQARIPIGETRQRHAQPQEEVRLLSAMICQFQAISFGAALRSCRLDKTPIDCRLTAEKKVWQEPRCPRVGRHARVRIPF